MIAMNLESLKNNERTMKLVRFCMVGALCTAIDAGLFYIIKLVFCYQVALSIAYIVSLIINYYLTTFWTFR